MVHGISLTSVLDMHVRLMHIGVMKLSEYMQLTGKNDAAIAAGVNRDRSTVTKWRLGVTRPDWKALAALAKFTNNAVTASDFVREEAQ